MVKHVSMRFLKTRVKEERSFHRWRRVKEKTGSQDIALKLAFLIYETGRLVVISVLQGCSNNE